MGIKVRLVQLAAGMVLVGLLYSYLPIINTVYGEPRKSRLNQLIRQKPSLYLPTRLVIGQESRFVARVPAGNKVVLFLSPQPEGFQAPNGKPLRVGPENQRLEAVASDKGVAVLAVPLPDEKALEGRPVFVDGYTYQDAEHYSDLILLDQVDATGRPAQSNQIAIMLPSDGSGPMVLPGMPGVDPGLLRRMSTIGDVYGGDDRKKQLMDDGDLSRDIQQDSNVFIKRPDGTGGVR